MEGHWDVPEDVAPDVTGSGEAPSRPFRPLPTEAHCSTAPGGCSKFSAIVILLITFYHIASLFRIDCSYNVITIVNFYNTVIIDING